MKNKNTLAKIAIYALLAQYNHNAHTPSQKISPKHTSTLSSQFPTFLSVRNVTSPPKYLSPKSTIASNTSYHSRELSPLEKCFTHPNSYILPQSSKFTSLPRSSHLEITRPKHSYGRYELVEALDFAGCVVFETYSVPLRTNDLSKKQGGKFPPHKSHRLGLDADIGIYTYNPRSGYASTNRSLVSGSYVHPDFSQKQALETNWTFVKHLIDGPSEIQAILVDHHLINTLRNYVLKQYGPEEWNRYNRFRHEPGHKDHYHIRIKISKKADLT